ncbi:uncharacterized protein LOC115242779 [Formica exsecta]|uniref:uncharacterized protein LOC115242779 n=1 Tax=Formica exsecta TaxID=72781 RepID=UPI001144A334|nr:uncharacterized protein LOC115242779 [Formica exsecta]
MNKDTITTKLAMKHKDSIALKENKMFRGEKKEIYKQIKLKRCEHLSFPWLIFSVFLVYWFILCPLIWAICYTFRHWYSYWPLLFWTVAFLIWIVIMCGLIIFRRSLLAKQNPEINMISKYGTDNVEESLNVYQISSKDTKSLETKKLNDSNDPESKKNNRENFLRKDLPPLVIHKQISGENIEDIGVVHVEKDENAQLDIASNYVEKSPLQDYLKLVTVLSPDEIKSPKTPMSPRELFFIDLIREAEKAENAKSLETKTLNFFSSETTEDNTKNMENTKEEKNTKDVKHRKDVKDAKNEKDEINESKSKCESNYFVADVGSPVNEKTEVFLQIDPCVDKQLEKPMLRLQSTEANSLKTFISQDN